MLKIIWRVTYVGEINSTVTISVERLCVILLRFSLKGIPFCKGFGLFINCGIFVPFREWNIYFTVLIPRATF